MPQISRLLRQAPAVLRGPRSGSLPAIGAGLVAAAVGEVRSRRSARQARDREDVLRAELRDQQQRLRDELQRASATREDLLATVSHEFRTPLTAIRGSALTMRKHRERLDGEKLDQMLDAIIANADRLGRLIENMLTAAAVREPDRSAVADVAQVAAEVVELVRRTHAERTPHVALAIDTGLRAAVEPGALHQILGNLLDNAVVHASPGSLALVTAVHEDGEIVTTVANEAHGVDAEALELLFAPFAQIDTSNTRRIQGAGMGLYAVRRLVEVFGGVITTRSEPGWISVEVRLPAAPQAAR